MNISFIKNLQNSTWMITPELASAMLPVLRGAFMGMEFAEGESEMNYYIPTSSASSGRESSIFVTHLSGVMMKHDGVCGMKGTRTIAAELREADNMPNVIGHIIICESGGGATNSVPELSDVIPHLTKPIVGYIDGTCCSAAIYALSYCNRIIASRESDTIGSVGVLAEISDFSKFARDSDGRIHLRVYADGCEDKNSEFEEALVEKFDCIKANRLNPIYEQFKGDLLRNRPSIPADYMTGKVYPASAVLNIFVDEIGPLQAAIDYIVANSKKTQSKSKKSINNSTMRNLNAIAGLEDLEVDAEGGISLNAEQLSILETGLDSMGAAAQTATQLNEATERVTELSTQLLERDTTIEGLNSRIAELEAALDSSNGGAEPTAPLIPNSVDKPQSPTDICRAHLKKF